MKDLLVQQDVHGAIDVDELPKKVTETNKKKIERKKYASILMNQSDQILRKVSKK